MAVPRSFRRQGIVLDSKSLGEATLLVTLLTSEDGKLRAVARGARKITSKLVGHLEPLTLVEMSLNRGSEFHYVSQVQVLDSFRPLKTSAAGDDLLGVTRGLYLAELASWYAVEEAPGVSIYNLLLDGLRVLPECKNPDVVLRCFEMQMLKVSGFMPELYRCVECEEDLLPRNHQFSSEAGGVLCSQCRPAGFVVRPLSLDALKVLRFLANTTLGDADRLKLDGELADEVSKLLQVLLSYWPDHEIRSRSFMDHVRAQAPSAIPRAPSVTPPVPSVVPSEAGTHAPDSAATQDPVRHTSFHHPGTSSPGASSPKAPSMIGSYRSTQ